MDGCADLVTPGLSVFPCVKAEYKFVVKHALGTTDLDLEDVLQAYRVVAGGDR